MYHHCHWMSRLLSWNWRLIQQPTNYFNTIHDFLHDPPQNHLQPLHPCYQPPRSQNPAHEMNQIAYSPHNSHNILLRNCHMVRLPQGILSCIYMLCPSICTHMNLGHGPISLGLASSIGWCHTTSLSYLYTVPQHMNIGRSRRMEQNNMQYVPFFSLWTKSRFPRSFLSRKMYTVCIDTVMQVFIHDYRRWMIGMNLPFSDCTDACCMPLFIHCHNSTICGLAVECVPVSGRGRKLFVGWDWDYWYHKEQFYLQRFLFCLLDLIILLMFLFLIQYTAHNTMLLVLTSILWTVPKGNHCTLFEFLILSSDPKKS